MESLYLIVNGDFTFVPNVRVYEPLRCQSALLSSYRKVTKRINLRKPAASNGLYTLLAAVNLISRKRFVLICLLYNK
jgi:hypothetical protein